MTSEVLRKILVAGAAVAALSVVACNKPKDAAAASDAAACAARAAAATVAACHDAEVCVVPDERKNICLSGGVKRRGTKKGASVLQTVPATAAKNRKMGGSR